MICVRANLVERASPGSDEMGLGGGAGEEA